MSNCSQWAALDDFSSYVDSLGKSTEFDKGKMQVCRTEICTAVYGTGNPDISGIGVGLVQLLDAEPQLTRRRSQSDMSSISP